MEQPSVDSGQEWHRQYDEQQHLLQANPPATVTEAAGMRTRGIDYLYWSQVLIGCAILTPWSAFLSSIDYFKDIYPDRDAVRWITLTYLVVFVVFIVINVLLPATDLGHSRVSLGLAIFIVTLAIIPIIELLFIDHDKGTDAMFAATVFSAGCLAVGSSVAEASYVGLILFLTKKHCQGYLVGIGISAVFIVTLRIITKAVFTDSTDGLRISARVFFFSAAILCAISLTVQRLIVVPHPAFSKTSPNAAGETLPQMELTDDKAPTPKVPKRNLHEMFRVAKKLKAPCLNLMINCWVTLTIYPGVPSDVECDALGDWYSVLLVAIFSIGDFFVRLVPFSWITTNPFAVAMANSGRILLLPIVFVAVHFASNPFLISFLILIHAVSNGYLFLCCFAMGQERMEGKDDSSIGGNLLMFCMITGLSLGSFCSVLWAQID